MTIPADHRPVALLLGRLIIAESDALHYAWPPGEVDEARRLFREGNEWIDRVLDGLSDAERERAWGEA